MIHGFISTSMAWALDEREIALRVLRGEEGKAWAFRRHTLRVCPHCGLLSVLDGECYQPTIGTRSMLNIGNVIAIACSALSETP